MHVITTEEETPWGNVYWAIGAATHHNYENETHRYGTETRIECIDKYVHTHIAAPCRHKPHNNIFFRCRCHLHVNDHHNAQGAHPSGYLP